VRRVGPLAIADACELIRQAAAGLAHAHEYGLVHRDIKPSNLMMASGGRKPTDPSSASSAHHQPADAGRSPEPIIKILDLGLALLGEAGNEVRELTTTGQMMGTLCYMAPEQGTDTHNVDIRADIYSLGATMYKLLCGEAPLSGAKYNTPMKIMMALAKCQLSTCVSRLRDVGFQ